MNHSGKELPCRPWCSGGVASSESGHAVVVREPVWGKGVVGGLAGRPLHGHVAVGVAEMHRSQLARLVDQVLLEAVTTLENVELGAALTDLEAQLRLRARLDVLADTLALPLSRPDRR